MIRNYVVYNEEGDVLRSGLTNNDDPMMEAQGGEFAVFGTVIDSDQYVNPKTKRVARRKGSPCTIDSKQFEAGDGSKVMISNVPKRSKVTIYSRRHVVLDSGVVNDGVVEISSDEPGSFLVEISSPTFKLFKERIHAV